MKDQKKYTVYAMIVLEDEYGEEINEMQYAEEIESLEKVKEFIDKIPKNMEDGKFYFV